MKKLFISFLLLLSVASFAFSATGKRIDQYSATTTLSSGDLFLVEKNPGSIPAYYSLTWAYVESLMKSYLDTYYQPIDSNLTAIANISGSRGDLLYYGASGWTNLPKGTSGYVLTQGTNDPGWSAAGGGSMVYPDAGVPVSTGTAWGTSIGLTGISDSTSTTSSTVAASSTAVKSAYDLANSKISMAYPGAGVPVSTGSAWGTSLNVTGITDSTATTSSTVAASATAVKSAYNLANGKQNYDVDLDYIAAGVTGLVKGLGNGYGYTAATPGTDYLVSANIPFYNVKTAGAVGNGSTDDTNAIQTAINTVVSNGGGTLYFPYGTYKITDVITISGNYVKILGDGRYGTVIKQYTAAKTIFNVSGLYNTIQSIALKYSAMNYTSGGNAIVCSNFYNHFLDLVIENAYIGIYGDSGSNSNQVSNILIHNFYYAGFYITNQSYNWNVNHFFLINDSLSYGQLSAIRLQDQTEGNTFTDGQIYQGVYALTTGASVYSVYHRPAYNKFNSVYFDSCTSGCNINNAVEIDFNNCWFSNRPASGIYLATCDGIRFNGGGAVNNGQNGVAVTSGATHVSFVGFSARGNSTQAAYTYSGIEFQAGAKDFSVHNCTLGGSLGFGTQLYGVYVVSGASDRYTIQGNMVTGGGGTIGDGGTGVNKSVAYNY